MKIKKNILAVSVLFTIIIINFSVFHFLNYGFHLDDWKSFVYYQHTIHEQGLSYYLSNSLFNLYGDIQRPIGYFFITLCPIIFGQHYSIYYILLVIINLASAYTYYLVFRKILKNRYIALMLAALIATNPIKNSVMFWLSFGLIGGLEQLFFGIAWYLAIKYFDESKFRYLLCSMIVYIFAIWTYNFSLIMSPIFLIYPIYSILYEKRDWRKIIPYLTYILISAIFVFIVSRAYETVGKNSLSLNTAIIMGKAEQFFRLQIGLIKIFIVRINQNKHILTYIPIAIIPVLVIYCRRIFTKINIKRKGMNLLFWYAIAFIVLGFGGIIRSGYFKGTPIGPDNRINIFISIGISIALLLIILYIFVSNRRLVNVAMTILLVIFAVNNNISASNYASSANAIAKIRNTIEDRSLTGKALIVLRIDNGVINSEAPVFYTEWDFDWYVKAVINHESTGVVIPSHSFVNNEAVQKRINELSNVYADNYYFYDFENNEFIELNSIKDYYEHI